MPLPCFPVDPKLFVPIYDTSQNVNKVCWKHHSLTLLIKELTFEYKLFFYENVHLTLDSH